MWTKPFVIVILAGLTWCVAGSAAAKDQKTVAISTLQELADYAGQDGNHVTMAPGVYALAELISPDVIAERLKEAAALNQNREVKGLQSYLLRFDGSNNTFDLAGVTIEVDTQLLARFKGCRLSEIQIDGDRVAFNGLTVRDLGDGPTPRGGTTMTVNGDDVELTDLTLHVRGSFPYGYGDLMGKGGNSIIKHRKHSGLLLTGLKTRLIRCRLFTEAFGHAFFIQGGRDIYFEDCLAEGKVRETNEMLAETSGPAFDSGFASIYKPKKIQPNYMKSLSECGFRTYGQGGPTARKTGNVTLVNCTAKNMRVGFALSVIGGESKVKIDNATAIGCERGFYLSSAVVENSRGDAKYGPLLYLIGEKREASKVELTLLPDTSNLKVNAVATIAGSGHQVTLKGGDTVRDRSTPIRVGATPPSAGEISLPFGEGPTSDFTLHNATGMPIVLGKTTRKVTVVTNGKVKDQGKNNRIKQGG